MGRVRKEERKQEGREEGWCEQIGRVMKGQVLSDVNGWGARIYLCALIVMMMLVGVW